MQSTKHTRQRHVVSPGFPGFAHDIDELSLMGNYTGIPIDYVGGLIDDLISQTPTSFQLKLSSTLLFDSTGLALMTDTYGN